jgi:D-arabinose 1-dehydrogenase-like Zn-dependent alcohol dehydrogenase
MGEVARAIVYAGPEQLVAREFPLPEVGDDGMIVEVVLCGVDGSELHMFKGELAWLNALAPLIFGDEIVGRVARIGEAAARGRNLKPGDLIAIEARWPCGQCEYCLHGN